ncbi:MAG TPA: AmmeMemoRadiSam system protein A [Pseudomonadales bacterium]
MPHSLLPEQAQQQLLQLARQAISAAVTGAAWPAPARVMAALQQPGACFVTLSKNGQLRGCIGSLQAHRPLIDDVAHNAIAAALHDPRFAPLGADELADVHIEISVLTEPQPLQFASEHELLAQITPFRDGLVLQDGHHRGTFLPLVWQQLPDKKTFLRQLKNKAGLPADYWSDTLQVYRYYTQVFEEQGGR